MTWAADPCAGVRQARFRKERVEGYIELARFQNTENRRDRRCPLREQDSDRLLPLAGLLEKRVRDAVRPRVELRIGKPITARLDGDRLWVTVDLLLETMRDRLLDRIGLELDELTARPDRCLHHASPTTLEPVSRQPLSNANAPTSDV